MPIGKKWARALGVAASLGSLVVAARLAYVLHRRRRRRSSLAEEVGVKVVVFDFDLTLSSIHVFKSLAGWEEWYGLVPEPHATTEKGQFIRLTQLTSKWTIDAFENPLQAEIDEHSANLSAEWPNNLLEDEPGQVGRLVHLEGLLRDLKDVQKCQLYVCTRGYIGVARKCLGDAGLLKYFSNIYGNVGDAYGAPTTLDNDVKNKSLAAHEQKILGDYDDGQWTSKVQVILQIMQNQGLARGNVLLVEDDEAEVRAAHYQCLTLCIKGTSGLNVDDMADVRRIVGCTSKQETPIPPPTDCTSLEPSLPQESLIMNATGDKRRSSMVYPSQLERLMWMQQNRAVVARVARASFQELASQNLFRSGTATLSVDALPEAVRATHKKLGVPCSSNVMYNSELVNTLQRDSSDPRTSSRGDPRRANTVRSVSSLSTFDRNTSGSPVKPGKEIELSEDQFVKFIVSGQTFQQEVPITARASGRVRSSWGCHDSQLLGKKRFFERPIEAFTSRYLKMKTLGTGAFGIVFAAQERSSGRKVAVKRLPNFQEPELRDDGSSGMDEFLALKSLSHPNLLRIFEVIKTPHRIYIVMEKCDHGDLKSYLHREGTGLWVRGAMQQMVAVVVYIHSCKIIHGDLKPDNVLVAGARPDGSPLCLVTDFGTTLVCVGRHTPATSGTIPGDPRYKAPEVWLDEGFLPESDVYMLGVTAFELLSNGVLPFFRAEGKKTVDLEMSYQQTKFGDVQDRILTGDPDWSTLVPIKALGAWHTLAVDAVKWMMKRQATERPTAIEVLRHGWLQEASKQCRAHYDEQWAERGWGLWKPENPQAVQRIEARAKLSWAHQLLLRLFVASIDSNSLFGARVLFRRLDTAARGALTKREFRDTTRFPKRVTDKLFAAGDINEAKVLDFDEFAGLLLDIEGMDENVRIANMQGFLIHLCGPTRHFHALQDPAFPKEDPVPESDLSDVSDEEVKAKSDMSEEDCASDEPQAESDTSEDEKETVQNSPPSTSKQKTSLDGPTLVQIFKQLGSASLRNDVTLIKVCNDVLRLVPENGTSTGVYNSDTSPHNDLARSEESFAFAARTVRAVCAAADSPETLLQVLCPKRKSEMPDPRFRNCASSPTLSCNMQRRRSLSK